MSTSLQTLSQLFLDISIEPVESDAVKVLRRLRDKYPNEMSLDCGEREITFRSEGAIFAIRADMNEDSKDVFVGTCTTFVPTREWVNTGYCFTADEALTRLVRGFSKLDDKPIKYSDQALEKSKLKKARKPKPTDADTK